MIYFLLIGFIWILLLGRNPLSMLVHLRFKASYLLIGSLAVQIYLAFYTLNTGETIPFLLEGAFATLVVCLILNREKAGVPLIGMGCFLNLLAILANGGKMPVSSTALKMAGLEHLDDYSLASRHSSMQDNPLSWLGDWIPFLTPVGTNYVLSPGDLVVGIGLIMFMLGISKRRTAIK
ncbi:DUF5317 domain-containing protein [Saccharibacillus kuerlensis]|uniref:DUF5317 domain-containing protein n=1 Tax=Saccharibacillus kuerlensis TaxID=459527 RepID=A0ABQ2L3Q4_9BACL|nr:DUF5317 domain-containing protein [Saccharibacillus kuerlensis]GGO01539.1 hypothetical protein GCM10010969_23970 [Saccharibacillus kuerlensis]